MSEREWVTDRLGVVVTGDDALSSLLRLALRHNPRRAHLLVSTVIGKHIPVDPRIAHQTGLRLGSAVGGHLGPSAGHAIVLGFAETATGLGHCVAEALGARYVHSTRRRIDEVAAVSFEEEHSHATMHRVHPQDGSMLSGTSPLVLVDDELSTGRTALNTIRALHRPGRRSYVVAALVDLREPGDRAAFATAAAELGVAIEVVSLASGTVSLPPGLMQAAERITGAQAATRPPAGELAPVSRARVRWPVGVREGGRHGFTARDAARAARAAEQVAAALGETVRGPRVLVLGTEELMYAPILIGRALARRSGGVEVLVSSTTRSPVFVCDDPDYPIRSAVSYLGGGDAQDGPGPRFAYNVDGFDDVVVVTDRDQPELVEALRPYCRRIQVVVLPVHRPTPEPLRGPDFGSYPAVDVRWLLTDLSSMTLEAPTEQREEAIQSGAAHYAESLPVEYQPDAEYRALFERALERSAERIAHAVGVVTEIVLAERGPDSVLVSLARAGTPVGVLMRRWARYAHGFDLPHYAVSIVRGKGIDHEAMRHLASSHEPTQVVFVDGWTGKGAIARELAAAITSLNAAWGTGFDPGLAVLADPGSCVSTFGTRADFLIPSACLNSTVSGLVSRTVRNAAILRPDQYDGARFYPELAADDLSAHFLDAVTDRFAGVADEVRRDWPGLAAGDRRPTWSGWAQVEAIAREHGIGNVNLVKPGVGETTRVLLRRVPWAVLIRPGREDDVAHIRLLAAQRGVPVHEVADLAYSCVGLIHPRFTRGATGADGRAVMRG